VASLLDAARRLAGREVSVITIDMPVATIPIIGRRAADDQISGGFAAAHCSTHSPSETWPGELGALLTRQLANAGYPLATADQDEPGITPRLVEVYPHPALLRLMTVKRRVAYKVGRSGSFWPGAPRPIRIGNLIEAFGGILAQLRSQISGIEFPLPKAVTTLAALKKFEDTLDALICAWCGIKYLRGEARAFGDSTSAIWVPDCRADRAATDVIR
jgi:predicted RNase H-like nuclease